LAADGVPVKADREQAWRVNYDRVLLALARMTMAPYAMWSSDRSIAPTVQAETAQRETVQGE